MTATVNRTVPRVGVVVAVALPGLALAVVGLFHPRFLAPSTATGWWQLHVVLLPLFPLLAVALWVLLRGEHGTFAWLARLAAYLYATFYTGLDALAGIAAGYATQTLQGGSQVVLDLQALGNRLGAVGASAFLVAVLFTAVVLVRRDGMRAAPGALVLVVAAVPFLHGHIYWPTGGLAMLGVGVGCAVLAAAARPPESQQGGIAPVPPR